MRLDRHIVKSRIIELESSTFPGAIKELLAACPLARMGLDPSKLKRDILNREKTMTTCLGSGVALPHVRIPMSRPYLFALGRCPEGLEYQDTEEYRELRFVFLMLASDKDPSYLNVLSSLAGFFQDSDLVTRIAGIQSIEAFREEVLQAFGGVKTKRSARSNKFNRLTLKTAERFAKGAGCSSMLIFGDTFTNPIELPPTLKAFKTIWVSRTHSDMGDMGDNSNIVDEPITVRSFSNTRLSQLRSAVLIGLTRGIIKYNERLCCVGGAAQSNQLDSLVVVDVEREFQSVFTKQANMLPEGIKPEVLERVLAIATELGVEGREGKPIGTMFVIGDVKALAPFVKPLVLNPFHGYKDEESNLLNPFMDETIKEYSGMDGAFVIRGDGVMESAGSLIHAPHFHEGLPSGLGTRHAAAAAISLATDCIAIVVSASTGNVTIFRQGKMLVLNDKGVA